jgi:hypothetical protein
MKRVVCMLVILLGISTCTTAAPEAQTDSLDDDAHLDELYGEELSTAPAAQTGILTVKGETVKVKLLDAFSGEVISNSDVEVHSDNGIRCIRAPCPTNAKQWQGKSDANGYVIISTNVLQPVTRIWTPAHKQGKDLVRDSEKDTDGAWVVELYPNHVSDSAGLGVRPIKLVDAQSDKPLSDTVVHIAFGETDSFEGTTNSLGYVFIPFEKALPALENTWVRVPGCRRAKIDFGWMNYRTKLERQ